MSYFKSVLFLILALISISGSAKESVISHEANSVETENAIKRNELWHQNGESYAILRHFRPVEDTAEFSYLLMSFYENGLEEVAQLRKIIAENLPRNMKLVILTDDYLAESVRKKYLQWISEDRLIIATDLSTEDGFWARDSFPVPVYENKKKKVSLIAANYFREFTSWKPIAKSVNGTMEKMNFTFVGGNLLADEEGNCFTVDSDRLFSLNEKDLTRAYGCKKVYILTYLRGIGDVDEVLKPLPGKQMLTNVIEYKNDLQAWGYEVILLPSLQEQYRTYVNSLILGKIVFMPVYDVPEDIEAQRVYEELGYTVIPIKSIELSDEYRGSIHCQTMAYPSMKVSSLLKELNIKEYKSRV